ncbi:MAG TPA: UrcA family protein [Steroidobacteraceae bacterium]|nr:UrcA family protein [Steroidobacteraceae bacterium]
MTSATLNAGGRLRTAVAFGVLATCTAIGAVGNAHAASAAAPSATVHYSALDLSTEQGSRALYGRIVSAAYRVCLPDDIRDLHAMDQARECRRQAIAQAVRDVNSPMLASVYAAHLRQG